MKIINTASRIMFFLAAAFLITFCILLGKEIQHSFLTFIDKSNVFINNSSGKDYIWMLLFFMLSMVFSSVAIVFDWMYREEKMLLKTNTSNAN